MKNKNEKFIKIYTEFTITIQYCSTIVDSLLKYFLINF